MSALKLLVHTCCAPCFIAPYNKLKDDGYEVSAYWFNPNIHPLLEYQKRRDTLREFCAKEGIELIEENRYGLVPFLIKTMNNIATRCEYCYQVRLQETAKVASAKGFDGFSTTLLYSRHQKHELIIHTAKTMAEEYKLNFFYEDWRSLWQKGIQLSKEAGMYRQQYCGCIFSEEDRYHE
ncbi:MAG: epoxyqueuosine reductase QueH [Candidatus Cloacimonetes bacterium]|nr:epoxyqueuosine reductase QueH [Candidatus Cloacimonadota bacterium]MDD3236100.1 epoxyqueuosine reductase QueH [Candidatus Cloacimonadota bacterium]